MKTYLLLFVFFISAAIHAQTLIAYYPLNGNAKDSSGNHFDGVITGGVLSTKDRNQNAGAALYFNGTTGRIDITDTSALRPTNFTLSAWFYISAIPSNFKCIVVKNLCSGSQQSYGLWIEPGTGKLHGAVSNYVLAADIGSSPVSLNVWHLGTMTFSDDRDSLKLYLDGALVGAVGTTVNIAYDKSSLSIGYELENCAKDFFFNGKIDDVRLYNGILSNKQVSQLYDSTIHRPGSGTAIQCDGRSSYVALPQEVLSNARRFTIEYWIKTTEKRSSGTYWQRPTMIGNSTPNDPSNDFGITTDSGRVGMWGGLDDSASSDFVLTNTKINDNKWHHIAAVNDGSTIILYVDGILQEGRLLSGKRLQTSVSSLNIGASNWERFPQYYNKGEYDEVRIWDKALNKQQIRDRMCHKISTSDTLYSHLIAYYNFDEVNNTTAFDVANYDNALLINNPQRIESTAPVGDISSSNYGGLGIKIATVTAASGETFTATTTTGKTSGVQVYVVNERPENLKGVDTLCNANKYFGVFLANDKHAAYSALYNYTTNPCVNATNENELRIYQISAQDSTNWYQLPNTPNINSNTITIDTTSKYDAKFILGLDSASSFITAKRNYAAVNKYSLSISVFPNPVTSQLNIFINIGAKHFNSNKVTLQVTDIAGRVLITKEVEAFSNENVLQLNVSNLAGGTYFIKIVDNNGNVTALKQFEKE